MFLMDHSPFQELFLVDECVKLALRDKEVVNAVSFPGPWRPGGRGHAQHKIIPGTRNPTDDGPLAHATGAGKHNEYPPSVRPVLAVKALHFDSQGCALANSKATKSRARPNAQTPKQGVGLGDTKARNAAKEPVDAQTAENRVGIRAFRFVEHRHHTVVPPPKLILQLSPCTSHFNPTAGGRGSIKFRGHALSSRSDWTTESTNPPGPESRTLRATTARTGDVEGKRFLASWSLAP